MAVNTGEAVSHDRTRFPDGELLVAGDVVNTASRLQSAAPPGQVLIGEETLPGHATGDPERAGPAGFREREARADPGVDGDRSARAARGPAGADDVRRS